MLKTKLYFTRHGETEDNVIHRLSTSAPGPKLTELGRTQAKELSDNLTVYELDQIYSSPLVRAIETATILNEQRGLPVTSDERLSELSVGQLEGRNDPQVFEELDTVWHKWTVEKELSVLAGPEGESAREVISRGEKAVQEIVNKHPGKSILVVAHSGILQLLVPHMCKNIENDYGAKNWLRNCQLVETVYESGELTCTKWAGIEITEMAAALV
ncbi:histidine phosphatase family protein [Photobacterium gaetbulicola]|uniref:Putative phosphoglycerate mutase n=1 Tax=Photobacterium gaetbulicola Gung47 TaxID=658445 RepID=A0A0C5WK58_9GAMM|nr:histidine phosphatase family protein [Photobacterium gaetbulicola]AJR05499.1 putative phosphoglycerate mutase [Photobacterium gaetbulicola Gung47]PST99759.1 histidine phosphatase family protein [Photobacterium gaetbulicola]